MMIKHIAISPDSIVDWCRKNNIGSDDAFKEYFQLLNKLLESQIKLDIPILTIYLLPNDFEKYADEYLIFSDCLANFFNQLAVNPIVAEQKVKISIFGKWYNLTSKSIEALKKIIEDTKDYDNFFTNFCINYDGQEEIVDACKLLAKQVELGKIGPEMITKDTIKESTYSSYFMPPDILLIYGDRILSGLLLWDSAKSRVEFADKPFMEFDEMDIKGLLK